jgi:DNA-binding transcriptional MocR family regulator
VQLHIDRENQRPLYLQVVEQVKERIRGGALPGGTRLPPVRQLAEELGLTRLTVHNAYAELQADGWIESFVGRGSFVARRTELDGVRRAQARPVEVAPRRPGAVGELMQMAHRPEIISFAQAFPATETFPVREFGRAAQQALAHDGATLYDYGSSQGEAALRDQLAVFLLDRAVEAPPEQIIVVGGAQQAIDVALRALLRPGETMLVEQPTYLGVIERMEAQGLRLYGVPVDEEGIRLDALEHAIALHRPRLLYTIPTFHNPTGASMSAERQAGLLGMAERYGLLILEDDIYGPLAYEGPAPLPLKARDTAGVVIYLTSFSKMFMPGLRLGLLAPPPRLVDTLVEAKRLVDFHAPQLMQRALAEYLQTGQMAAHLRAIKPLYRERRDAMLRELRRAFPPEARWTTPSGGFSLWVELPPGLRSMDLYLAAIERGVAFAPGEAFFAEQPNGGYLRLSWAAQPPDAIARGLEILGDLLHEQTARYRRLRSPAAREVVPMV